MYTIFIYSGSPYSRTSPPPLSLTPLVYRIDVQYLPEKSQLDLFLKSFSPRVNV